MYIYDWVDVCLVTVIARKSSVWKVMQKYLPSTPPRLSTCLCFRWLCCLVWLVIPSSCINLWHYFALPVYCQMCRKEKAFWVRTHWSKCKQVYPVVSTFSLGISQVFLIMISLVEHTDFRFTFHHVSIIILKWQCTMFGFWLNVFFGRADCWDVVHRVW